MIRHIHLFRETVFLLHVSSLISQLSGFLTKCQINFLGDVNPTPAIQNTNYE